MNNSLKTSALRVVVLISGNGSNLQAVIDDIAENDVNAQIVAVISNNADAYGLTRARNAAIPVEVISNADYPSRESYDQALQKIIEQYQAELIVLAGFMRILSDDFVNHYTGKMINIHPSLLPKYQGLNTHQRALDAGETEHGASVHFVSPELDSGPIILQAKVPIEKNDNVKSLAQRVHDVEHIIYPQVIRWFAEHKLKLENDTVLFEDSVMNKQQKIFAD